MPASPDHSLPEPPARHGGNQGKTALCIVYLVAGLWQLLAVSTLRWGEERWFPDFDWLPLVQERPPRSGMEGYLSLSGLLLMTAAWWLSPFRNRGRPSAEWLEAGAGAPPQPVPDPVQVPSFGTASLLSVSIGLALALMLDGLRFTRRVSAEWEIDAGGLLLPAALWFVLPLRGRFPGFGPQLNPEQQGLRPHGNLKRDDWLPLLNALLVAGSVLSLLALWGLVLEWKEAGLWIGDSPRWIYFTPLVLAVAGVWLVPRIMGRSVPQRVEAITVLPRHGRRLRVFFLTHVTLMAAGSVWLSVRLHERRRWDEAMAKALPGAMDTVPASYDTAPPASRFREGCRRLAVTMDLAPEQVEGCLVDRAREIVAEENRFFDDAQTPAPARLILSWLSDDPLNPQTLNRREEAAVQTGCVSDLRALLALRRTVQPEEHPDLLRTREWRARFLTGRKGDPDYREEMRDIIRTRRTFQPPEAPALLSLQREMAQRLLQRRDYTGYEECIRELLPVLERMRGNEASAEVYKSRHRLAGVLREQKKYSEEEKERRLLLDSAKEALFPSRLSVTELEINRCQVALGWCLMELGKDGEAWDLALPALTKAVIYDDRRISFEAAKLVEKLTERRARTTP